MKEVRIAVPPGVGDVYWALSKMKSFKQMNGYDRMTMLVQRTSLRRATDWAKMVDFIDECHELRFRPDPEALAFGMSFARIPGADYCFWPNAIVDRGQPLESWMPQYPIDLNFNVKYAEPPPERAKRSVVYASSESIHNAWFPMLTPKFWSELIAELGDDAAVIGAAWDESFRDDLAINGALDLVGSTTLMEVTGIIKSARAVVGVISGMTILANHWMTPCVAFCPNGFVSRFPYSWVKEGAPYIVLRPGEIHSAAQVAELVRSIARPK